VSGAPEDPAPPRAVGPAAAAGDGGGVRPPEDAWLLLWDIDGTLLLKASGSHAAAVWDALRAVHGLGDERLLRRQPMAGMTDGQIARRILEAAGVDAATIDARQRDVAERTVATYAPEDLTGHVSPGVDELLAELHSRDDVVQSLVTGNFEPVARRKLAAAGLGGWFSADVGGGFGDDHEERAQLPGLARRRAGEALRADGAAWPPARTIVIGDTPRDIACARHDGVHVVAVATGGHPVEDLREADAVARDARELRAALLALIGPPPAPGAPRTPPTPPAGPAGGPSSPTPEVPA
jgi:phosphoglycolate phosphatase-like HAD superfamily hydrolase